jgi:uncharacterized protein (TIGR02300 family)
MAELNWGGKHLCLECQAPFYDMRRKPITCPKCGAIHKPVALLKSDGRQPRRNRLQPTLAAAQAAKPQEDPVVAPDPEDSEEEAAEEEVAEDAEEVQDDEMAPADDEPTR